jgi:predicted nucleic acid-binding protein
VSPRYLIDTDVLWAGAPSKVRPVPKLFAWMDRNSERLYVSVLTIAELEDGMAKSQRAGMRSHIIHQTVQPPSITKH